MQGCWPAEKSHTVKIEISRRYDDGRVLLKHGRVSEYLSEYVTGKKFHDVMEEVVDVFNEIGRNEEKGYKYQAVSLERELIVHMYT